MDTLNWEKISEAPLPWLLEPDPANPGVRYFALVDLLELPDGDSHVVSARQAVMTGGPVPAILSAQDPQGFWCEPGPGYGPKYRSTVWSITLLAQLGADGQDSQVRLGCEYVLDHSRCAYGGFSAGGNPSGLIHCLQGNLAAALLDFGFLGDERLHSALDWLARSITGEGIAPAEKKDAPIRYYRSANSAPGFVCSANNQKPCAWGAVKAMLAFSKVPSSYRTPAMEAAIQGGGDFLLRGDPASAGYSTPYDNPPSRSWFQFGFPVFYVTDVLQNLEVLTALGYSGDLRLEPAIDLLLSKQDKLGRWKLEYTYNGKTWTSIEQKGQPSKWVTLRALRVLKRVSLSH